MRITQDWKWRTKVNHLSSSQVRMDRVNDVRLRVIRPRQVGAVFTEYLVAFVTEQPLERRIDVLRTKRRTSLIQTTTYRSSEQMFSFFYFMQKWATAAVLRWSSWDVALQTETLKFQSSRNNEFSLAPNLSYIFDGRLGDQSVSVKTGHGQNIKAIRCTSGGLKYVAYSCNTHNERPITSLRRHEWYMYMT